MRHLPTRSYPFSRFGPPDALCKRDRVRAVRLAWFATKGRPPQELAALPSVRQRLSLKPNSSSPASRVTDKNRKVRKFCTIGKLESAWQLEGDRAGARLPAARDAAD